MNARAFWLAHALLPTLLCLLALAALDASGADFAVADRFFDPVAREFPARAAFFTDKVLHDGGRWLLIALGGAALAWAWRRRSAPALYLFLCLAAGPGLVAVGKHWSAVDCPWDLARYGGTPELAGGHCFPSGHSSGAFALFAFYFLLRERQPRAAVAALAAALAAGILFAWVQWARGAHFPTHDVASAWICWHACLALYPLCLRARAPRPDAEPMPALP